jgi:hypothetical protein
MRLCEPVETRMEPIGTYGKPQITRFRTFHQSDMSFRTKIGCLSPLRCADFAMYGKLQFEIEVNTSPAMGILRLLLKYLSPISLCRSGAQFDASSATFGALNGYRTGKRSASI